MEKLTENQILTNALREIAAHAIAKGGEWASDQAFKAIEFAEQQRPVPLIAIHC